MEFLHSSRFFKMRTFLITIAISTLITAGPVGPRESVEIVIATGV